MNKEMFCKSMARIDEFLKESNEFSDALYKACDGHPVLTIGNWLLDSFTDLLSDVMGDKDFLIPSFIFERPLEITVTNNDEEMNYNIKTYDELYDYLIENREE